MTRRAPRMHHPARPSPVPELVGRRLVNRSTWNFPTILISWRKMIWTAAGMTTRRRSLSRSLLLQRRRKPPPPARRRPELLQPAPPSPLPRRRPPRRPLWWRTRARMTWTSLRLSLSRSASPCAGRRPPLPLLPLLPPAATAAAAAVEPLDANAPVQGRSLLPPASAPRQLSLLSRIW